MHSPAERDGSDPCILKRVQPLLAELDAPIHGCLLESGHDGRQEAESFIRRVFAQRHRADVQSFYPTLLGFGERAGFRAVVGFRGALEDRLFAEQYLDEAVETLIRERIGQAVSRTELVEVGNLALANPGDARWVIAAATCFLHALGYRWVLFTATRTLINAFQRLGLQPLVACTSPANAARRSGRRLG